MVKNVIVDDDPYFLTQPKRMGTAIAGRTSRTLKLPV
jgi:hypothetical protein